MWQEHEKIRHSNPRDNISRDNTVGIVTWKEVRIEKCATPTTSDILSQCILILQ